MIAFYLELLNNQQIKLEDVPVLWRDKVESAYNQAKMGEATEVLQGE